MKKSRTKILFFSGLLGEGGAQRQISYLLKYLDREKYEPILCLYNKSGTYLDYIPKDVKIQDLSPLPRYISKFLIFFRFLKLIKQIQPDIVFSNIWEPNLVNLFVQKLYFLPFKSVICVENNPDKNKARLLRKWMYPHSDLVIACSRGIEEHLHTFYKIPEYKLKMIYNSVDIKMVRDKMKESVNHEWFNNGHKVVIAVGRLHKQKGYTYLLKAIKKLNKRLSIYLMILGDGPDKGKLRSQIEEFNLNDNVQLLGFQSNPFKYIVRSDVFVSSSLWEGLSCVLTEAQACGVPIVATDAPYGSREVLTDGTAGWLVPTADADKLAEVIKIALENREMGKQFIEREQKVVEKKFAVKTMIRKYEDVFTELMKENAND